MADLNVSQVSRFMRNPKNYYAVERKAAEKDRTAVWLLRYWHIYVSVSEIEGRNDNVEEQLTKYFSKYIKRELNENNPIFRAGYNQAVSYSGRQTVKRNPVPSEDDHDKFRDNWPVFMAGFDEGISAMKEKRENQDGTEGSSGTLSEV